MSLVSSQPIRRLFSTSQYTDLAYVPVYEIELTQQQVTTADSITKKVRHISKTSMSPQSSSNDEGVGELPLSKYEKLEGDKQGISRSFVLTPRSVFIGLGVCSIIVTFASLCNQELTSISQKVSTAIQQRLSNRRRGETGGSALSNTPSMVTTSRSHARRLRDTKQRNDSLEYAEPRKMGSKKCRKHRSPPPLPGKKGAAFTLRDIGEKGPWTENILKVIDVRPYWNYNWSLETVDAQPRDIEFVPMVWGSRNTDALETRLETQLLPQIKSGKVKRLLGFNEPDYKPQANMKVSNAVKSWPILEDMDIPLVSPSAAHAEREWMESFMGNATENCLRTDWVGVHWYGNPNVDRFKTYMKNIHKKFGRPILITEFAPADWSARSVEQNRHSPAEVLTFMKQALPWLEEQEWVAGYAWFSFGISSNVGTSSALFDEDGKLTTIGRYYASVRTNRPRGDQFIYVDGL